VGTVNFADLRPRQLPDRRLAAQSEGSAEKLAPSTRQSFDLPSPLRHSIMPAHNVLLTKGGKKGGL
jgi:hypothetical protein